MIRRDTRGRPELALMWSFWQVHRAAFLGLALLPLVFGAATGFLGRGLRESDLARALGYVFFALALFGVFGLSCFTEPDRRGRFAGYPSRLFTVPVSTMDLVTWPMVAAIGTVLAVYVAWAALVFPALGVVLPLGWPCLYLSTGMACFLAIVWALAGFRLMRLLALGVGGTIFPIAWNAFREEAADSWLVAYVPGGSAVLVRPILLTLWVILGLAAYGTAYFAVERQRRGGRITWSGWRKVTELVLKALPRGPERFRSGSQALAWQEWRRQGSLLPLCVGVILFLIVFVSAFQAPLGSETTTLTLFWILIAPLALAWVIGPGIGKIDLWSRDVRFPTFLATRPVADCQWIGVKLRVAGASAGLAWLLILIVTPIWLWACCDLGPVARVGDSLLESYSLPRLSGVAALFVFGLVLLTWRLLVARLYVGLSGNRLLMNTSVCFTFVASFGSLGFVMWAMDNSAVWQKLLVWPAWLPWVLAGAVVSKLATAGWLAKRALRLGILSSRAIWFYVGIWAAGTGVLVALVWLAVPLAGRSVACLVASALLVLPASRIALAAFAVMANRRGQYWS